jgi:hypothetical protein
MPILHIEHAITDLDTWLGAFRKFAPARERAGVLEAQVFQPDDDPNYIVINLRFETTDAAVNFHKFLRSCGSRRRLHPHWPGRRRPGC